MRLAWISDVQLAQPPSRRQAEILSCEQLFEALDGRTISVFHRTWRINIYSICEEAGWRWLQIGLDGQPDYTVTVRTSPHDTLAETLHALSSWLARPSKTQRVLSVA
jgi:hypothetical protein